MTLNEMLRVVVTPRREICRAQTCWDTESAILHADFVYPEQNPGRPDTLREYLDQRLEIHPRPRRVIFGNVDIMLDPANRLELIESRTSPGLWRKVALPEIPIGLEQVRIEFQVEYDLNQIAKVNLAVATLWDPFNKRLALRFQLPPEDSRWYSVADTAAIRLKVDGTLCELAFQDVVIPVS